MARARPYQRPSEAALAVRQYLEHGDMGAYSRVIVEVQDGGAAYIEAVADLLSDMRHGEDLDWVAGIAEHALGRIERLLAEPGTEALARIVDRCQRKTTRAMPGRPSDAPPGGSRAWSWS